MQTIEKELDLFINSKTYHRVMDKINTLLTILEIYDQVNVKTKGFTKIKVFTKNTIKELIEATRALEDYAVLVVLPEKD